MKLNRKLRTINKQVVCCKAISIKGVVKMVVIMEIIFCALSSYGMYVGRIENSTDSSQQFITGLVLAYGALFHFIAFVVGLCAVFMNVSDLLFWFLSFCIAASITGICFFCALCYGNAEAEDTQHSHGLLFISFIIVALHFYCNFIVYRYYLLQSNAHVKHKAEASSIEIALHAFITWEYVMFIICIVVSFVSSDNVWNVVLWSSYAVSYASSFCFGLMGVFMKQNVYLLWFDCATSLVTIFGIFIVIGPVLFEFYFNGNDDVLLWVLCIILPIGYNVMRIYANSIVQTYRSLKETSQQPHTKLNLY
eukprot:66324_1